jgi:homoserine O-acetyltransferase
MCRIRSRRLAALACVVLAATAAACGTGQALTPPEVRAPDRFQVRLDTTKGSILLAVERALAPRGADRFHTLVRERYFDDSRFFRVVPGRWAQFGIAGDPSTASAWRSRTFSDDPPRAPNAQGFAPFAHVVYGMDVVLALNGEYGESSGGGIRAGKQDPMFREGNAWLDREFPRLDRIRRAEIATVMLLRGD